MTKARVLPLPVGADTHMSCSQYWLGVLWAARSHGITWAWTEQQNNLFHQTQLSFLRRLYLFTILNFMGHYH